MRAVTCMTTRYVTGRIILAVSAEAPEVVGVTETVRGKSIARIVSGLEPEVEFAFCGR